MFESDPPEIDWLLPPSCFSSVAPCLPFLSYLFRIRVGSSGTVWRFQGEYSGCLSYFALQSLLQRRSRQGAAPAGGRAFLSNSGQSAQKGISIIRRFSRKYFKGCFIYDFERRKNPRLNVREANGYYQYTSRMDYVAVL